MMCPVAMASQLGPNCAPASILGQERWPKLPSRIAMTDSEFQGRQ